MTKKPAFVKEFEKEQTRRRIAPVGKVSVAYKPATSKKPKKK